MTASASACCTADNTSAARDEDDQTAAAGGVPEGGDAVSPPPVARALAKPLGMVACLSRDRAAIAVWRRTTASLWGLLDEDDELCSAWGDRMPWR